MMENNSVFCPKCGAKVPSNSRFCQKCGYDLSQITQGANTATNSNTSSTEATSSNAGNAGQQQPASPSPQMNTYTQQNDQIYGHHDDRSPHTKLFLTLGWISFAISAFIFPTIFGVIGCVFGFIVSSHDATKKSGITLIVACVIATFLGLLIGQGL